MKVRVKLGSQNVIITFEQLEPSGVRLADLRLSVCQQFHLEDNQDFQLSLNKIDALSGEDQTLDTFGIVSGDLIHVIGAGLPQISQPRNTNQVQNRPQPIAPYSSSSNSSVRLQECNTSTSILSDEQPPIAVSTNVCTSGGKVSTSDPAKDVNVLMNRIDGSQDEHQRNPEINRYLLEPLVVRESTERQVPILLSQLYQSANCSSNSDALWVAVHTLVLETGFWPSETQDSTIMPNNWKCPGYYSCTYDYMVSTDIVGSCLVVGVSVGASIIVHGLTKSNPNFKTDQLQLRCTDFTRSLSHDVPATYRGLDRLSRQFKDIVCLPLINEIVTAAGFPERQGLQALPFETKLRVISFLDAASLCQLGQTCLEFNSLYKDKTVWRMLYIQAFGKPTDCSLSRNWYELFKVKFQKFKEEQDRKKMFFHMDETDPPWGFPGSGPLRIVPPGMPFPFIIGGDYDVNPEFTSGIVNPLGGRRQPGPLFPQVAIPDPFSSGLGNIGMPGLPRPGAGNLTGSPFSSNFRGPFI